MARDYNFWVYVVTNRNDSVCTSESRTACRGRLGSIERELARIFPAHYQCKKLIYYERDESDLTGLGADVLQDR
jgi:hypothetical protein